MPEFGHPDITWLNTPLVADSVGRILQNWFCAASMFEGRGVSSHVFITLWGPVGSLGAESVFLDQ